ncbi:hypothetical protein [Ruegeria sp. HKCCD6157]|uniref:hypothetical protein n=1 Tax=Ruegeria sp. HKCCD6157 TaxID=2690707 RepID=UPI001490E687|nr:hypothetical protein [Ruegeria sp. HKCCD6157]NOE28326.1 hypothetical protein [Ruegeria sp. HKCCD6157]
MTEDDIAAFHQRFFTQKTLADEYNGFWRTLVAQLQAGGVEPFTSDGETFGHLFLRADVERFFEKPVADCKSLGWANKSFPNE